jgi:putative ABC transport system permease protein
LRDSTPCLVVVGVVRDFRVTGGVEGPMAPVYYVPFAQTGPYARHPQLFVRLRDENDALRESVRRAVQGIAADAPVVSTHFIRNNIGWLTTPLRLGATVFTAFGILAAMIAGVGLAGVLSFLVRQQRKAYAVRVALGAPNQKIVLPLVTRALVVVGAGMAVGFASLVPLRRIVEPMLFHTKLLGVSMFVVFAFGAIIAVVASIAPARDILSLQPMRVLREE